MQPGSNGFKGPDNSVTNTAIFDTISWYWANHFPIVPSDYATNLLKIRLSDDVLKLAEDTSRDGDFFKRKQKNGECWAWWVFPSFSDYNSKFDFNKPENIESGRCISRLILCSPEYINAYTKIIEYVAKEIDKCKNNPAELESRFEKNVDFFKMLQCILNLYTNIPVVWDKCEDEQLLLKFCDALAKFSDSMKAIKSCKLSYGQEINKKNDININFIKALNEKDEHVKQEYLNKIPKPGTIFLGLQHGFLEGYIRDINTMQMRICGTHGERFTRRMFHRQEPFPEINKKFFGDRKIRNDHHYLIIKYYDEYLKNGGTEDIDEFLLSKEKEADLFYYERYKNNTVQKIQTYAKLDAPSLLCFFNLTEPRHRLNMIKECIEMEKKHNPPRTDIMSILIYEYSTTVKQEYIKELPDKDQLYIIKDFFPGTQVENKSKYVEDKLMINILTKISEQLNSNDNLDTFANNNNLPRSVISEDDMPFRKYIIKYKQVDEEKKITQNSPIQPQINSFPVRKRYHDLMLKYCKMDQHTEADNIYDWITYMATNARDFINNLSPANLITPQHLVCLFTAEQNPKQRLNIIKKLLKFPDYINDPELMALMVNEYYSIMQNQNKLAELSTILRYYLDVPRPNMFIPDAQKTIKTEMLKIKDILDKTNIENLDINDNDVTNFKANEEALFDTNELQRLIQQPEPLPFIKNHYEGAENIRKDLYGPIQEQFRIFLDLRKQDDDNEEYADIQNIGMFVKKEAETMDTIFDKSIKTLAYDGIDLTTKLSPALLLSWFNNTKDKQLRLKMIRKCCEVVEIIKSKIKQKQTTEHDKEQYAKFLATIVHEYYIINNLIQPSVELKHCFDNYFGYGHGATEMNIPPDHLIAVYEEEIEKINAKLITDEIEKNTTPIANDNYDTPDEKNDETQEPKNNETTEEKKYIQPINNIPETHLKRIRIMPYRERKKYAYWPKKEAQKNKKEINRIARRVLQFFIDHNNPNRRLNLLRAMIKSDEIDKNIYTPLIVFCYCHTLNNPQLNTIQYITHKIVKDSNLYGFGEQHVNDKSKAVGKAVQCINIIKKNFDTFSNQQILAGMTYTYDNLSPNEDYFQPKFSDLYQDENKTPVIKPHQQEDERICSKWDIYNLNLIDENGQIMFKNLGDLNDFFSEKENHAWEKDERKSFNLLEDIEQHQKSINSRIRFVEDGIIYDNCRLLYYWFEKHTDPEERLLMIRKIYNQIDKLKNLYDLSDTANFASYMFLITLNDGDPGLTSMLNAMMEIIKKGDKITKENSERAIKIKEWIMQELNQKTNKDILCEPRIPRIKQPNNKTNKNFLDKKRILSDNSQEKLANAIQNGLLEIQQQPNRRIENKEILQNLANYAQLIRQAITT